MAARTKLKLMIIALILLTSITGCAGPESSRLAAGDKVLAYDSHHATDAENAVAIFIPAWDRTLYMKILQPGFDPHTFPHLHIGDKMTVMKDEDTTPDRRVDVKVETGEISGEFGSISRADLRPAK